MRKIASVAAGLIATAVLVIAPVTSAGAAPVSKVACGGCWGAK